MATVTIISEGPHRVDAEVVDGRFLIEPDRLSVAIGWDLKPEGLCRPPDICVPVRDRGALFLDGKLDISAVAAALHRTIFVDAEAGIAAIGNDAEIRRQALDGLQAPDFVLNDLAGKPHRLSKWRGTKKLLFAFASW